MHDKWMRDADYRREYAALEEEFAHLAGQVAHGIKASVEAVVPAKFDHSGKPKKA